MYTIYTMNTQNKTTEDLLEYEIYPAIFDNLDDALPEFEFERKGNKWQSKNTHKISGRKGKTAGQVIVYEDSPTILRDASESLAVHIWKYVRENHGENGEPLSNGATMRKLAEMAGVQLPALDNESQERIRVNSRKAEIWEALVNYWIQCIQNKAKEDQAIVDYLTKERRYSQSDAESMGLAYAMDWTQTENHLKSLGYGEAEIREHTQRPGAIGTTHRLAIPIRNPGGQVLGIIARNVNYKPGDKLPKYLNSNGLPRGKFLFNLGGRAKNGRVLLVEGQLDAAICTARNFEYATAAAIGSKGLTREQVNHILKAKAREVIICLDNEDATRPNIRKAIDLLLTMDKENQLEDRIYIAQLPDSIKDIDQLVTMQGIETLEMIARGAVAYYKYEISDDIKHFYEKLGNRYAIEDHEVQDALAIIKQVTTKIKNPVNVDGVESNVKKLLADYGIDASDAAWAAAMEAIKYSKDKADQERLAKGLISDASDLLKDGNTKEALDLIENKLRSVKLRDKKTEYDSLLNTSYTLEYIRQVIKDQPTSVKTGFKVPDGDGLEDLEAPASQLTFFAAPTNHGKTNVMLNIALNVLQENPGRTVHFFTFEMDAIALYKWAFNIFLGGRIAPNNRRTINTYFESGTDGYVYENMREIFHKKSQYFFSELVDKKRLNIHYVDYSADELIGLIEYIQKSQPGAVIIVDYIQKLRSNRKGNINHRFTELKFVCEDLNAAAIRLQLPVIMGAQFKREVRLPLDMHPTGMAEASDIEKIASEIIGIWNCTKNIQGAIDKNEIKAMNDRYNIDFSLPPDADPRKKIIIQVLKSRRMGTGGVTKLEYNEESGKVWDIRKDQPNKGQQPGAGNNKPMYVKE